jgi:hypothetical protein
MALRSSQEIGPWLIRRAGPLSRKQVTPRERPYGLASVAMEKRPRCCRRSTLAEVLKLLWPFRLGSGRVGNQLAHHVTRLRASDRSRRRTADLSMQVAPAWILGLSGGDSQISRILLFSGASSFSGGCSLLKNDHPKPAASTLQLALVPAERGSTFLLTVRPLEHDRCL